MNDTNEIFFIDCLIWLNFSFSRVRSIEYIHAIWPSYYKFVIAFPRIKLLSLKVKKKSDFQSNWIKRTMLKWMNTYFFQFLPNRNCNFFPSWIIKVNREQDDGKKFLFIAFEHFIKYWYQFLIKRFVFFCEGKIFRSHIRYDCLNMDLNVILKTCHCSADSQYTDSEFLRRDFPLNNRCLSS